MFKIKKGKLLYGFLGNGEILRAYLLFNLLSSEKNKQNPFVQGFPWSKLKFDAFQEVVEWSSCQMSLQF